MAEWFKAAVLKTVECQSSVGSNPTPSAIDPMRSDLKFKQGHQKNIRGEMAESAEGARLLSECAVSSCTEGSNPSLSAILKRLQ